MPGKIYKRGNIYWIGFSYRGTSYRRSAQTKKRREAEKLLAFYLGQCARDEFKGFGSEKGLTLVELLADFVADYKQRGLRDVQITEYRSKNLRAFFKEIPAADITERKIDLYVKHRLKLGRSRTTINRELQLLGQALRLAKRKRLIREVPHIEKFSEKDNARQGFFEHEEFERIVGFLPDYLKDLTRFAYHTGWRKGEILTLEWRDIHGDVIRLRPEIAKNKDGRVIILVGELANLIDRRRAERVESCPYVFHRQGQPIKDYSRAWGTARTKAGAPERLFHDSRRTAARNMDRARVPRSVAKQIIGHKTDAMYNRYRIVDEQDIREGMRQSENYLANTNEAHLRHN
jgi:integrase